ncbi:heat shock protein beta-9 [Anomaloglossus baeobatrachus]|uniref:heat shock protein beta-9 n=1 Tax=Anomaloglossus baeobatrachus TaxID=238106 RepID=UPI003F504C74
MMLSFQLAKKSTSSPFRPFLRPLWPLSTDIFSSLEQNMIHTLGEIKASVKLMDQFHQQLLREIAESKSLPVLTSSDTKSMEHKAETPLTSLNEQSKENKAETALTIIDKKSAEPGFVVSLGVQDFSPQELTVKLVGNKLLVSGAKECKSEDGKGSFSYKCQIFRKEVDLPQNVRAEDLSCSVTNGGQLQIEVSRTPSQERTVPIQHSALQAKARISGSSKDSRA